MADPTRCDVLLWDVSGVLLDDVARRLRDRASHDGPKVSVHVGELSGRRVALARAQRVTAVVRATLGEVAPSLFAAHRPLGLVVVGPAGAAPGTRLSVGDVRIASRVERSDGDWVAAPEWRLGGVATPTAELAQAAAAGAPPRLATDWAGAAVDAVDALGVDALLVAVVARADGVCAVSRRATRARSAGRWLGALLSGATPPQEPRVAPRAVADAIDRLLGDMLG